MNSKAKEYLVNFLEWFPFLAAIFVMLWACYAHAEITEPPAETEIRIRFISPAGDISTQKHLDDADAVLEAFQVARRKLLECGYFEKNHRYEYIKLYFLPKIDIIVHDQPHRKYCGLGYTETKTVILFQNALDNPAECEQDLFVLVGHEMLHIVDMPKHKRYTSKQEYFMKDPIEQVVFWCLRPIEATEKDSHYGSPGLR
jgi:hypothetical protein